MPSVRLPAANSASAQLMLAGASCASLVFSVVGPRNTLLVAFTQEKTVPTLTTHATSAGTTCPACSAAVYSNHLLAKPLMKGTPIMLPTLISHVTVVRGMRRARPPSSFMSRVPVACCTLPAARNSPPLKRL